MSTYKHISLNQRRTIEEMLGQRISFTKIAKRIGRSKSTVSREVIRNSCAKRTGAVGQAFNNCSNRNTCAAFRLCKKEDCTRQSCKGCKACFRLCPEFERENCHLLTKHPYVCNGCGSRHKCTLEKFIYAAAEAHRSYLHVLTSSRDGIAIPMEEILRIDKIISPLLKKKQSIHVIMENHKDEIMLDEKTIRNYVNAGLFSAKKTDLLNTVKMRPRKAKIEIKVERACRDGRSYRDFIAFMRENPDTAVVQMDTVEGGRGTAEPVILTIHFVEAELMLAFLREANTAKSVVDVINRICDTLGLEVFRKLFPVVLTDRGSEFSSPSAIEMDANGRARTKLFYTDPGAPYQKGACENNHSLIRRVIPKGRLLSGYSQDDLNLLMNHINSYKRKKLKNRSPIEVFNFLHNDPVICTKLGVKPIAPDDVNLSPSLFRR